jgi:hypothetical protein
MKTTLPGLGPIATNRIEILKRAAYRAGLSDNTSELEIFCGLCVGRVFFSQSRQTLYFVDSPVVSVSEIIEHIFKGLNSEPIIHQLYMDEHSLITAASSIKLTPGQRTRLFVALNISGIHIDSA